MPTRPALPTRDAITRTAGPAAAGPGRPDRLLSPGETVASCESGLGYEVDSLIGSGGFGQVYLVRRTGRSLVVPDQLCLKVSTHLDAWLREAYFGRLLDNHDRAIRVYDIFPVSRPDGCFLYCLALEWARHGDLSAFLLRDGKGWPERSVRREIAGILEVLGKLHRGQMLHRDLTPLNVFVCDRRRLKLGDFGIVRQQSDQRGVTARTMNALTAPSEILAREAPKWQARDDVYQVGQLLAMLIRGTAKMRVRPPQVRDLQCSDHLKEIVHRCIGERRKRYESADELIEALSHPPAALTSGVLRSLAGAHVAFTGILRTPRRGGGAGRRARWGDSAQWPLGTDRRGRSRAPQPAAGGRPRRRLEADGDQAAARQGAPRHALERSPLLAAGWYHGTVTRDSVTAAPRGSAGRRRPTATAC